MLGVDYDDFGPEEEGRMDAAKSSAENYIHIYPNPASDEINISYSLEESDNAVFLLTDLLGREVMNKKLSSNEKLLKISTVSLEQGIYFVCLKVNDESIGNQKLLIIK
ncbi:MAG TPA: T9SS type A sorting domain-containing protein [Bacteroidia bacterium]|nr:T9SS type A sorting domain-containing protein [Bacteroidia bacterium]